MIKAIVFDCFGVFYVDPVLLYTQNPASPPAIVRDLEDLDKQAAYGMLTKADFITEAAALLGIPRTAAEARFMHDVHRDASLVAYTQELRASYRIGLLSNLGGDMMDGYFTATERRQLFDAVVLSGDTGLAKPELAIFILTCERLGVMPHEAVMVDDSARNIEAAQAAGMHGIVYTGLAACKTELERMLVGN